MQPNEMICERKLIKISHSLTKLSLGCIVAFLVPIVCYVSIGPSNLVSSFTSILNVTSKNQGDMVNFASQ